MRQRERQEGAREGEEAARAAVVSGARPEPRGIAPVAAPGNIDATHDVVSGANSARDPNGPIYIDKDIPQYSPILKDRNGQAADLHKYLAIHESVERDDMARWAADFKAQNGRDPTEAERTQYYSDVSHPKVATAAERAAVEADGRPAAQGRWHMEDLGRGQACQGAEGGGKGSHGIH